MTNNIFSIKRFFMLLQMEVAYNWKKLLVQWLALIAVLFASLMFASVPYTYIEEIGQLYINNRMIEVIVAMLALTALFVASTMNQSMRTKKERMGYLMLPASVGEKFWSRVFTITILFFVAFAVATLTADGIRVLLLSAEFPSGVVKSIEWNKMIGNNEWGHPFYNSKLFFAFVVCLLFFQSLFALGSSIWGKYALGKNLIALAVVCFVAQKAMQYLYGRGLMEHLNYLTHEHSTITIIVALVATIGIWALSYYRLKRSKIA